MKEDGDQVIFSGTMRTAARRLRDLKRLVFPSLGERPITEIKRSEIVALLDQIQIGNGPVMADRVLAAIRAIMNWHWSQRRQYIIEHRAIPPAGWDNHLQRDNYVEPPESEGMPPVDVIDTPQGFKVLSNLLPKPGSQRKLGNGTDSSGDDHS